MKGFTLIEFVVIISIFAIMAAVALFSFNGFKNDVALSNLAHDVALTIRQAQVFGWSTTSAEDTNGELLVDSNGNPLRYADGIYFPYDNGAFDPYFYEYTKTDTIDIQGTAHISAICTASSATDEATFTASPHSTAACGGSGLTNGLSIAFSRPRPEAIFFTDGSQVGQQPSTDQFVNIYISATGDAPGVAEHMITVSSVGEITVQ